MTALVRCFLMLCRWPNDLEICSRIQSCLFGDEGVGATCTSTGDFFPTPSKQVKDTFCDNVFFISRWQIFPAIETSQGLLQTSKLCVTASEP